MMRSSSSSSPPSPPSKSKRRQQQHDDLQQQQRQQQQDEDGGGGDDDDEELQRVAHLPFLIQKMKSKAADLRHRNQRRHHNFDVEIEHPDAFTETDALRNSSSSRSNRNVSFVRDANAAATGGRKKKGDHHPQQQQQQEEEDEAKKKRKDKRKELLHGSTTNSNNNSNDNNDSNNNNDKQSNQDAFLDHAVHLENLMNEDDDISIDDDDDETTTVGSGSVEEYEDDVEDVDVDVEDLEGEGEGRDNHNTEETALLPATTAATATKKRKKRKKKKKKKKGRWHKIEKRLRSILRHWRTIVPPSEIRSSLRTFIQRDVSCYMVPLLLLAMLLFYVLGNPNFEFLPNTATLAWYLLFVVRLHVTYTLSRVCQFVIVDVMSLRTSYLVETTGPFITLVVMQSMGWPFLLTAWGIWNSILVHGRRALSKHWLNWTNISVFTVQYNPDGDGILQSEIYSRLLFAMIFVGTVSALKRTTVALFLSRRMLRNYKPQLEHLMIQVQLITGLAELANETTKDGFQELLQEIEDDDNDDEQQSKDSSTSTNNTNNNNNNSTNNNNSSTNNIKQEDDNPTNPLAAQLQMERKSNFMDEVPTFSTQRPSATSETSTNNNDNNNNNNNNRNDNDVHNNNNNNMDEDYLNKNDDNDKKERRQSHAQQWQEWKNEIIEDEKVEANNSTTTRIKQKQTAGTGTGTGAEAGTGAGAGVEGRHDEGQDESNISVLDQVYATLDRYDPPKVNTSKEHAPSFYDILQFKKANAFMSDGYPFTKVFGRANNRKNCIKSAIQVFYRLQQYTPDIIQKGKEGEDAVVSFNVIGAIAYKEDGTLDKNRAQGLLKMFLPDKNNNHVSLRAFVQAVDSVYRQIIFLNASMSNSSKIDSVLEDMFNVVFYGVIAIVILSLLGLNLWPLLVSFSTMLISVSFALGPSCAKTIEGIMAIAVRRPFDLGDRISLAEGLANTTPGTTDTWIVEDINLTTTTLRLAATNEVSTINNSSLSGARIINCARSHNALIRFRIVFRADASLEDLDKFKKRLEQYILDRPRIWVGLIQFANDGIDSTDGYITYMIGVKHVKSWQDLGKIVVHRGEIQRDTLSIARELNIHYETPPDQKNIELVNKTTNVS